MTVALVTDSTAYLPADLVAAHGIRVVPVRVALGDDDLAEGVAVTSAELAAALRARKPVRTAAPSPRAMLAAYEEAAVRADAVVSVHLSGAMSSTVAVAQAAARSAPVPVEVVDSRSVAMGLGYAVLAAAEVAGDGGSLSEVAAMAGRRARAATLRFSVDTLEYLRRGGRIGAARSLLGTALAIKPILGLVGGTIVPVERVRTSSRALARLEALAIDAMAALPAGSTGCDVAVHHLDDQARADRLGDTLREHLDGRGRVLVTELGAVVGAHVGPGTLATVVSPRFDAR